MISDLFSLPDGDFANFVNFAVGAGLIYAVVLLLVKNIERRTGNELQAKPFIPDDLSLAPRLPLRPGARTPEGDLLSDKKDEQRIVAWHHGFIHSWILKNIEEVRPLVTDAKILELAETPQASGDNPESPYSIAVLEYVEKEVGPERSPHWFSPDYKYAYLVAALNSVPGAAYTLADEGWADDWIKDNQVIYELYRLDADMDFAPAAFKMQIFVNQRDLLDAPFYNPMIAETYLRHFFDLGAPVYHFEIAAQLGVFYLWNAMDRPDDGYLAAALDRVRDYDRVEHRRLSDRLDLSNVTRDLDDQSVSRVGLMAEMMNKEKGRLN